MPCRARLEAPGTLLHLMIRGIEGKLKFPVKFQYLHGIILSAQKCLTEKFSQLILGGMAGREGTRHLSRGELPDFHGPDFRFFASGRLGRKIIKPGGHELFPHLHKFKHLEVQRCGQLSNAQ